MSGATPSTLRKRRHRGRPRTELPAEERQAAGATQTRLLAARVLERVERSGAYADLALDHALARSSLVAADRALCTELVYGTLRWRGRLDFYLAKLLDTDFAKLEAIVSSILRVGAYQVLFMDRIPATTAVDQSVRCARALGAERATGLVNAVLRRLVREQHDFPLPTLEQDPTAHLVHALSLPRWIADRWLERYGPKHAADLARACNIAPRLTVRANRTRISSTDLLDELRTRFPEAERCVLASDGIVLGRRGNPRRDPAFLAGRFTVQDEASQLVIGLLDPQPGDTVLDTCAAPGGKTTGIAERVGPSGEVLALDRHSRRLQMVARDSRRLGLQCICTLERDATQSLLELTDSRRKRRAEPFDRVLVDAPCTGLGALRRNPDARWRVRPEDSAQLAKIQRAILDQASRVLKVGGRLVYSTCTLLPEENEELVMGFLNDNENFRLVPRAQAPQGLASVLSEEGFLRCLPHLHDTDGFFAAGLERVA